MDARVWAAASQQFPAGASGDVDVFLSKFANTNSIWSTEEYGTLINNPNVGNIYFHLVW
jgi:hypothetical protein